MSNQKTANEGKFTMAFAALAIPVCILAGTLIYMFLLGNPANYEEGNPMNHPLDGNLLGTVYKGGIIVPILVSVLLIILTFSIERFITISKAKGKGSVEKFVISTRQLLSNGQVDAAIAACDVQKGSVANVIKNGLSKYKIVEADASMDKESKLVAIQKDIEEATSLELPMLSKNLIIISTCASIATLIGLIGTVVGMIRAFSALAQAGSPDATALSTGISEALINTFLGISGSAIAIVMYNYFSTKIDTLTYSIDEAGYSIVKTFDTKHNK
jgi:biopolymer transport protein ExbB